MAINWNLFPQALQNEREGINKTFDWSFVTPELVKGFTRYQALRPEQEVKEAKEYEKSREGISEEDMIDLFKSKRGYNQLLNEYLDKTQVNTIPGISSPARGRQEMPIGQPSVGTKDWAGRKEVKVEDEGKYAEGPDLTGLDYSKDTGEWLRNTEVGKTPVDVFGPDEDARVKEFEKNFLENEWKNADKESLREELLKQRLGGDYNTLKRSFDIYGTLNPYEQMLEAGKRSSYWDPVIGKIYTDAAEKIRNDNITAWKEALEGESNLQKQAMDMYKQTGLSRYRREAESRLDKITELLKTNPRITGNWFKGYDTISKTNPETASAYGELEKKILEEGPMAKADLLKEIKERGLKGEDVTDLLKQNDAEWAKRYGPTAETVKRTEEAIRAQSETFKKDQTERIKNLNLLDDLRTKLSSKTASESDYRMAAETLRKLNLDITKSFDPDKAKLIETAKKNMVNTPSFKTIGAFLVLTIGDKLGVLPGDLNAITASDAKADLIKKAIDTLYDTDLNMYEVERENMEGYLKDIPGVDTSSLSWMKTRRPEIPEKTEETKPVAFSKDVKPTVEQLKAANPELKDFTQWNAVINNWSNGGGKNWVWDTSTGKITKRQKKNPTKPTNPLENVKAPAGADPMLSALLS